MVNIFNLTKCDERIQTRVSVMIIYRDISCIYIYIYIKEEWYPIYHVVFCACPKLGPGYQTSYVVFLLCLFEVGGSCCVVDISRAV
jgi:hypothetical protein